MASPENENKSKNSSKIKNSSKSNVVHNSITSLNSWNESSNAYFKELEMKYYMKSFQIAKSVHELKNVFITISSFIDSMHFTSRNPTSSPMFEDENKSKGTLVSQNSIFRTFTSFLQKNNEINTNSEKMEFLKSLCDFGINLIADITAICKGTNDNNENKKIQPFNLYNAIIFCAKIFQARCNFEHKGFDVKCDLKIPDNTYIDNIDEVKLKQVLINILSNSFKFTLKGEISVTAYKTEDKIRISIQDTGLGFDVSEFTPLRPYKIYEKNQKYNKNGSGLGLCIISDILTLYNSHLNFDSQKGSWSKFWFDLEDTYQQNTNEIQSQKNDNLDSPKSHTSKKKPSMNKKINYNEKNNSNYNYKFLGVVNKGVNPKCLNSTILQDIEETFNDNSTEGHKNSVKFMDSSANEKKKSDFCKAKMNEIKNFNNIQLFDKKGEEKYIITINQIINNNNPLPITRSEKKLRIKGKTHLVNSRNFHNDLSMDSLSNEKIQKYLKTNKTQTKKKSNFLNNIVQKNFIVNDINRSTDKINMKKNEKNKDINNFLKTPAMAKLGKRCKKIFDSDKNYLSPINKTQNNIKISKENNLFDSSKISKISKINKLNKLNINTHLSQKKYTLTKLNSNKHLINNKSNKSLKSNNNNSNNKSNTIDDKILKIEIFRACSFNFLKNNLTSNRESPSKNCDTPVALNQNKNESAIKRINIIICDDDQFVALSERNIILEYFKKINEKIPKIYMTRNGIECIYMIYKSLTKNITINLVIIDENMPFLNGTDTCSLLKNSNEMNFIPICLLSGDGSSIKEEECSADMILSKPLNKNEFNNIFEKYLANIVKANK